MKKIPNVWNSSDANHIILSNSSMLQERGRLIKSKLDECRGNILYKDLLVIKNVQ